ncbi:Pecanex-like protein 4 [Polyrhizophydium stewartii]|uniref:Pecanex-like protein 4 n=1 Tax=Polyrhizophydium stewartii TaxID=2732419 RepID=A0ABR4N4N1_9FUNG
MPAPLLNEYKATFAARRYVATLSGGPALPPPDSPLSNAALAVVFGIITLAFPAIAAAVVLVTVGDAPLGSAANTAYGATVVAVDWILHTLILFYNESDSLAELRDVEHDGLQALGSDEDPPLAGPPISSAFDFVFNQTRPPPLDSIKPLRIVKGVVAGIMSSAVLAYLAPSQVKARYHTEDRFRIDDFSRPAHVAILLILWGLESSVSSLANLSPVIGVVFAALPALWAIGFLPALRIMAEKMLELVHRLSVGPEKLYPVEAIIEGAHALCRLCIAVALALAVIFTAPSAPQQTHKLNAPFATAVVAVAITLKASREIQQVYIPSPLPILMNPLRVFDGCRRVLVLLGWIHRTAYHLAPLACVGWVAASLVGVPDVANGSVQNLADSAGNLNWIWAALMLLRSLTLAWHKPEETLTDICILLVTNVVVASGVPGQDANRVCSAAGIGAFPTWWCSLDPGTRLFFVTMIKDAAVRLRYKATFWLLGVKHFLFNAKQRHPQWYLWMLPILIISPVSIVIAAALDAPTLSFLGLPLLVIGFPRPTRMWASINREYTSGQDAKVYSSMAPSLMRSLSENIASGRVPPLRPGDVLLARLESRLLLLRGVETWFEGASVVVTGAELEPTSCHALEGAEVDGILDYALIDDNLRRRSWINDALFHTLLPVGTAAASSYVESKAITTGILDNPGVLRVFPSALLKVLVFCLLRTMDLHDLPTYRDVPVQRQLLQTAWKRFPLKWFEHLKSGGNAAAYHDMFASGSLSGGRFDQQTFDQVFMMLCISCHIILLGQTATNIESYETSASALFDMYRGNLPYSVNSECRTWWSHTIRAPLRRTCIQALRYAVKLVYEEAVEGEVADFAELESKLDEFVSDWVVTMDPAQALPSDPTAPAQAWRDGMNLGKPHFFALFKQAPASGASAGAAARIGGGPAATRESSPISVRILNKQDGCVVRLGIVNGEAVRGIWANLVFELLYLTNDDDERYSIQAHEILLRNLTVQTAPPPFGYPIWVSASRLGRAGLDGIATRGAQTPSPRAAAGRVHPADRDSSV